MCHWLVGNCLGALREVVECSAVLNALPFINFEFDYSSSQRTHWVRTDNYFNVLKLPYYRLVFIRFNSIQWSNYVQDVGLFLVLLDRLQ